MKDLESPSGIQVYMGCRMTNTGIFPALLPKCQPTLSDTQVNEDVERCHSSISWVFNGILIC